MDEGRGRGRDGVEDVGRWECGVGGGEREVVEMSKV